MTYAITSAAPRTQFLGTEDLSTRTVENVAEQLPQHLPKVFLFAKKGPTEPQLVIGNSRNIMYGDATFDYRGIYANHATVLSNTINAAANAQIIERLKPVDAAHSAIRIWLDVLETTIPEYIRNTDGSYQLDVTGNKVPTGSMITGHKAKFVVTGLTTDVDTGETDFGNMDQRAGNQTDGTTQSVRYPIMDIETPDFGLDGTLRGVRLWAPTEDSNISPDTAILEDSEIMAFPFRMACVYKTTESSTPSIVSNTSGEKYIDVCFKKDVIHPKFDKKMYIGDTFIDSYQNLDSVGFPPVYGPFGKLHIYYSDIAELLQKLYTAEEAYIASTYGNFDGSIGEEFRFNFVSGLATDATPYHSYVLDYAQTDSVKLSESSNVFAIGGSDGTMTEAIFNELVSASIARYSDEADEYTDSALHPEKIIYDSGFSLATKYELCKFIAVRKDTMVVLSVAVADEDPLTISEESSVGVALRTRLQNYPESDYFGTEVMRGMVIGRSGILLNSQWTRRLPLTIEVASKAARYMGAGDGYWKSTYNFDRAPRNQVTMFKDVNIKFTPITVRNKDWANGLNWVQAYDRRSLFWPAFKTVYGDDTSVLNSFITVMACCQLQRVGEEVWRDFSGVTSLTKAQLAERVEEKVSEKIKGIFDERFTIIPEVYYTDSDDQRGYSWSLRIKLYANNMMTVMTLSVQAHRMSDLETTTA